MHTDLVAELEAAIESKANEEEAYAALEAIKLEETKAALDEIER